MDEQGTPVSRALLEAGLLQGLFEIKDTHRPRTLRQSIRTFLRAVRVLTFEKPL